MPDRLQWPEERPSGLGSSQQGTEGIATPPPGFRSGSWTDGAAPTLPDDGDLLRERVERSLGSQYGVEAEVGRGGMAVVYRARERSSGRLVALKVLRSDQMRDPETIARFEREAMVTLRLRHPLIVQTYAVHSLAPRGMALALEFMGGGTVKDQLRQFGPLAPGVVQRIVGDVALALSHAHAQGVVHRDLKPDNIFIDPAESTAKVGDFGIARAGTGDELTLTGTTIGTPAYMSPEQIDGRGVDGRSDVYSLGLVAWEMLSGKSPWSGEPLFRMIERQRSDALPAIGEFRRNVPRSLIAVIERCLEKAPERRFQSMHELARALGRAHDRHDEVVEAVGNPAVTPAGQATMRLPTDRESPIPAGDRRPPSALPTGESTSRAEAHSVVQRADESGEGVAQRAAHSSAGRWGAGAVAVGTVTMLGALLWLVDGKEQRARPEAPAVDTAGPAGTQSAPAPRAIPPALPAPVPPPTREDPVVVSVHPATPDAYEPSPELLRRLEQLRDEGNYVGAAQLAKRLMPPAAYRALRDTLVRACAADAASSGSADALNCGEIR